jgi:hypothetical protein
MKEVKKILFPIDFAESYTTLLPWVTTLVQKFEATLYVAFVTKDLSPRQYQKFSGGGGGGGQKEDGLRG